MLKPLLYIFVYFQFSSGFIIYCIKKVVWHYIIDIIYIYMSIGIINNFFMLLLFSLLMPEKHITTLELKPGFSFEMLVKDR